MNNTQLLLENLFSGDLKGILKTVISIDDFESKIDYNTIVLAFYCTDEDAAEDLAVFLERAAISRILDTEVSTSTNKDNDYLVFVEVSKSKDVAVMKDTLDKILHLCNTLIGIEEPNWRIKNMRLLGKKLAKYNDHNLNIILKKVIKE